MGHNTTTMTQLTTGETNWAVALINLSLGVLDCLHMVGGVINCLHMVAELLIESLCNHHCDLGGAKGGGEDEDHLRP